MKNILENREERIKVFLNKGYTVDIETGKVFNTYGKECKCLGKDGYVQLGTTLDRKQIQLYAHQLIYYVATCRVVDEIDHINGDRYDNRRDNLREVTRQENNQNRTKAKGYTWLKNSNKWQAQIKVDSISINLKSWNTEQEAHKAYLDAKKKYHIL